ncbi:hypothetical protein DFH07DRAFT_293422 [Mycena maculata]|uniref:Uncharacterized protein n=1 Tax=Mycena maculata TaxID=230809 RepID=A0AAD7HJM1_9AGAR|nr:hypothetical protein DFH07DRAFT_293422 [Mycena maculata]
MARLLVFLRPIVVYLRQHHPPATASTHSLFSPLHPHLPHLLLQFPLIFTSSASPASRLRLTSPKPPTHTTHSPAIARYRTHGHQHPHRRGRRQGAVKRERYCGSV